MADRQTPPAATRLRCRLGLHRWDKLGHTTWLNAPTIFENRLGVAMEYRPCLDCGRIKDVSTFTSSADPDLGVVNALGPLATKRFREIMAGPRVPLIDPPIPWDEP